MDKYINNQLPSEENMENTNSSENNEQILENSKLSFLATLKKMSISNNAGQSKRILLLSS